MLKKRNELIGLAIIVVLIFIVGCVTFNVEGPKRISEMTPKERATWFLGVYNAQDKDYRNMVVRSDLANDQKEILREKKKIMTQVYPMIKTYNIYVDSGAVPTKETEDQIIKLINDLTALIIPKLE